MLSSTLFSGNVHLKMELASCCSSDPTLWRLPISLRTNASSLRHLQPTRTGRLIYCDTPLLLTSSPTKSLPLTNATSQSDLPATLRMRGPWACPCLECPSSTHPHSHILDLLQVLTQKPPFGGPSLDTLKCQHLINPDISRSPSLPCSSPSFITMYLTHCMFYSALSFMVCVPH